MFNTRTDCVEIYLSDNHLGYFLNDIFDNNLNLSQVKMASFSETHSNFDKFFKYINDTDKRHKLS